MTSIAGKTVRHTSLYAISDIIRHIVAFLMLPIYTRFLTPADYGVVELLTMMVTLVQIVLAMRTKAAVFRYYSTTDDQVRKRRVISTSLLISVVVNSFGVLFIVTFSDELSSLLFGDAGYSQVLALFATVLLLQSIEELGLTYLQAQQRPLVILVLSIGKLLLQVSLNVYFLVFQEMHVLGVVYSSVITGLVMASITGVYLIYSVRLRFSQEIAGKLIRFSIPLILTALGSFYITFGDRYFLRIYTDLSEVGIYSLAYKFGFLLAVMGYSPFSKIWATQRYEVLDRDDATAIYQRVFLYVSLLLILVGLGISLAVKDVIEIMADESFHDAYRLVPVIVVAYIFQSWMYFNNFGLHLKEQTSKIAYCSVMTVVVITAGYFTLIPAFGSMGAALATVIAFAFQLYWVHRWSSACYDMRLPWGRVFGILGYAVLIYGLSVYLPDDRLWSIAGRLLLIGVFLGGVLYLPLMPRAEKHTLRSLIRDPGSLKSLLGPEVV